MVSSHTHNVYVLNRQARTQVSVRCKRCGTLVELPKAQVILLGDWMWVKTEKFVPKTGTYKTRMFQVPRTKRVYGCIDCSMELLYQKEPPQPPISGPKNEKHFLEAR